MQSGEVLEFYARDIIECLRTLWGDPDFDGNLIVEPERLYADEDTRVRIYHDMNTGKWWWDSQVEILSLFRAKVGLTIILEKSPGYNSKQEHYDCTYHYLV